MAGFTLASGHLGLEIKTLYHCTLYSESERKEKVKIAQLCLTLCKKMFKIQRGHEMKGNWPSYDIYILGNIPSVEQLFKLFVLLSFSSSFQHTRASLVALVVKNLPANAGDLRDSNLIPGSGRCPGGGHGNPHQYSCPENPHGQRSLVGCSPKGHKESDTTEAT